MLEIEGIIPHAQSLKHKRSAVKGLVDRLRARFNASVAETGYLDEWQRSLIVVSMVSNSTRYLERQADLAEQVLRQPGDLEVIRITRHWW